MLWFFTLVFMIGGHLPVITETYEFSTKQACISKWESKTAEFAKAGQGYLTVKCDSK